MSRTVTWFSGIVVSGKSWTARVRPIDFSFEWEFKLAKNYEIQSTIDTVRLVRKTEGR